MTHRPATPESGRAAHALRALLRRSRLLSALALCVLAATFGAMQIAERSTMRWVLHTREVLRTTRVALREAIVLDLDMHAAASTGAMPDVPARLAVIEAHLDTLQRLTAAEPDRQARAREFTEAVERWSARLSTHAIAPGDERVHEALAPVRAAADRFLAAEEALYDERVRRNRQVSLASSALVLLEILGLALLLSFLRRRIGRQGEELLEQQTRLEEQAVELEEQTAELEMQTLESREYAERLAQSEGRFRALIERASESILLLDREGVVRYASASDAVLFGYPPEERVGRNALELVHPEDRPRIESLFAELLQRPGGTESARLRYRHHDGRWCVVLTIARNLLDDPAIGGVVVNSRDVTAQAALEEQLHQAQKMEAVGQLAGGIAHDFNNILTVITAYVQLLLDALPPGHPLRDDVVEIRDASTRAAALTRQLLLFSRKKLVHPTVLDVNAVVTDVERMLRRLLVENIRFETALAPDLQPVLADAGQIEQVLMNLVVNARDAMPEGGRLRVETSNVSLSPEEAERYVDLAPGRYARIAVADSGTGMDRETVTRIFEPFFTTKERGHGTGLGLATVYGIVRNAGGHVEVHSEPGRGTTFEIYLPVVDASVERPAPGVRTPALPRGGDRILLVEDDDALRRLLSRALRARGYTVVEAHDGGDALRLVERDTTPVTLVVTDVVMPELGGPELVRRLRQRWPSLLALFVSGYADDELGRPDTLEPGDAVLEKPFTADALVARVGERLGAARTTLR